MITANLTSTHLTICIDGEPHSISVHDPQFNRLKYYVTAKDKDSVLSILGRARSKDISGLNATNGPIEIVNGKVFYNRDEVQDKFLSKKIVSLVSRGLPSKFIQKFLCNLDENPDQRVVSRLYTFLSKSDCPITEDGHFLAYRKVDENYMSYRANPDGTRNRNKIGDMVTMKRNRVNSDDDVVCSSGLHFCSHSYLPKYVGNQGRVMIVKVNPCDVVSIPIDYNDAKGRCCRYEVVGEHTSEAVGAFPGQEFVFIDETLNESSRQASMSQDEVNELIKSFSHFNEGEIDDHASENDDVICEDCGEHYMDCTCEDEDEDDYCEKCDCKYDEHGRCGC